MGNRIGFGVYQFWRNMGTWDMCLCFGCGGVGGVGEECVCGLGQGMGWWIGVMSVCVVSLDSLMAGPGICILC